MNTAPTRLVIALCGDIDHHKASRLRQEIDTAAEAKRPDILELDFQNVTFMDSSGIGLIMGRYKLISSYSGKLEVINVPRNMAKVIKLSGIERLGKVSIKGE